MDVRTFLEKTHGDRLRPKVQCVDGFTMSVQASKYHYCTPRDSDDWRYTEAEVGFPSSQEDLLMPYAESPEKPTGTVYDWVPVDVVQQVIDKHGGIAPTLPNMVIMLR